MWLDELTQMKCEVPLLIAGRSLTKQKRDFQRTGTLRGRKLCTPAQRLHKNLGLVQDEEWEDRPLRCGISDYVVLAFQTAQLWRGCDACIVVVDKDGVHIRKIEIACLLQEQT